MAGKVHLVTRRSIRRHLTVYRAQEKEDYTGRGGESKSDLSFGVAENTRIFFPCFGELKRF